MDPSKKKKEESKLNKEELEKLLTTSGLKQSDIKNLKEHKWDEITQEGKELLESLEITAKTIKELYPKNIIDKKHEKVKELGSKEIDDQEPKKILAPRDEMERFLRERSISESLINTLLKVGFTQEFGRLLTAMEFTTDDIETLQHLWELDTKNREETDSFVSLPSSSDEYLSPDGLFLKNFFSKLLTSALREIIAKKPIDPVEYLGHWLLNHKICEERDKKRKEFELQLLIERERMKLKEVETVIPEPDEEEEEEENVKDWNFFDYE